MKNIISTAVAIVIAVTLIVCGIVFNTSTLSALQIDTLLILLIVCGVSILYCFISGELSRNNSQMDKLWSILPIIYVWIIAIKAFTANGFNLRILFMAILVTIWGSRLTYNFAKKGAYSIKLWRCEEDYRWIYLRKTKYFNNKVVWCFFDLIFISIYQNVLVLLITLPAVEVMENNIFSYFDIIPLALTLGFIVLETVADKQQRRFYDKRKELMKDGAKLEDIMYPYSKGFNTTGIWKYSRHPNYFFEQAIWISFYLFSVTAGYGFNYFIIGSMLLVLLFLGSSTLSEGISKSKYPLYEEYIKTTSKFIPWFKK